MKRIKIEPRYGYIEKVERLGFNFSSDYWLENAYYEFTKSEVDLIYGATRECYNMYVDAVQYVIDNNLWEKLHIPKYMVNALIKSWDKDDLSLYGRFDFAFINGIPKLLEFNADTPTSLFEASVVQWNWKEEMFADNDQFNSIHEALVNSWCDIHEKYDFINYSFTSIMDSVEDATTTNYLASTASEAGLSVSVFDMGEIGEKYNKFYINGNHIDCLFKLYPYEWMFNEEFGRTIPGCKTKFIEPLWKAIMSNKYMLVIISELFPNSPYILKATDYEPSYGDYCKKPIFSREGANVTLVKNNVIVDATEGEYGEEGYIYQELVEIEPQHGKYPIIGSWVIGGESHGIGIRETDTRITDNMSNFVPHIIE